MAITERRLLLRMIERLGSPHQQGCAASDLCPVPVAWFAAVPVFALHGSSCVVPLRRVRRAAPILMNVRPTDALDALQTGTPHRLLGVAETQELEFKRAGYRLDVEAQCWELGKDVAAMANGGGGLIIVGVATGREWNQAEDIVTATDGIARSSVSETKYRSVIAREVYPPPEGVRVIWVGDDPGFLVIVVPAQPSDQSPAVLPRVFAPDSERPVKAFAVPSRDGSDTTWLPVGIVHRDLADGRRSRTNDPEPATPVAAPTFGCEDLRAHVEHIEQFMGWSDLPTLAISAWPRGPGRRPDDLYSPDGLAGALHHPPVFRSNGFGLSYAEAPKRIGQALVVTSQERCIWLEHTGVLTAATSASTEFLAWAQRDALPDSNDALRINAWVIAEYTLTFTTLVEQALIPRYGPCDIAVSIQGASGRRRALALAPGAPDHAFSSFGQRQATGPDLLDCFPFDGTAEQAAFRIVLSIYEFFGHRTQDLPFAEDGRIPVAKFAP